MSNWFDNPGKSDRGNVVVEFAFVLPLMVLMLAGMVEIGRGYYQANAVERAIRAAALFASRGEMPLSAAREIQAENLVRTGTLDGSGDYLVAGWADGASDVDVDSAGSFLVDGVPLPVVRVTATVPFDPMLPGLLATVGLDGYTIVLSHEQAMVGD